VIVAAEAAAAEAIICVRAGLCCHQCRNPKIQFKKKKKEETQNEENEKKEKIGGDEMQIGDDRKNRTTDRNPLANNRNRFWYVRSPYSCGVVLVFLVLVGNSFWCFVRT
jgi:hypothetical protein